MSVAITVAALLADATQRLAAALHLDKREARIEARVLLAHILKADHAWLIAHDRDMPTPAQQDAIERLIARRATGEPVAYILGEREFYGRTFMVTPDVLIPRPETELLVESALSLLAVDQAVNVLDIGTGSGAVAISLALERPLWRVHAVDIDANALACAQRNAARLAANVTFGISDVFAALDTRQFDLIVSNPPYIAEDDAHLSRGDLRFEPRLALASGPAGLDVIARLVAQAPRHLTACGYLLLEHGWQQDAAIRTELLEAGFESVHTRRDLAGLPRISGGRLSR